MDAEPDLPDTHQQAHPSDTAGRSAPRARRSGRSARWQPQLSTDIAGTAAARTWVREALPGLLDHPAGADLAGDVELLLSELCTNAVRHGGGLEGVHLDCTSTTLRVTVHDAGAGALVIRNSGAELDHGRGLILVEAIAAGWGVQLHPDDGKDVWFEVNLTGAGRAPH
ncbi:ATP-binding protein [Dactylosporangium sp. McL0621]|uniref:ATP-binding protein n=1 Tax=Dactylosporangium sp. McL0621 TaxID=3415678 RepID=UPI003CF1FFA7